MIAGNIGAHKLSLITDKLCVLALSDRRDEGRGSKPTQATTLENKIKTATADFE